MNLWQQEGVPHKGWTCFDMVDLGMGNYESCGMCGNERIRFVHYMRHDEHESVQVGCVCAEKMSGDYLNPKQRERDLRNRAKRRQTWSKQEWFVSKKGNDCLKFKGVIVCIYKTRDSKFKVMVDDYFDNAVFNSIDRAKANAFDIYDEMMNGRRESEST